MTFSRKNDIRGTGNLDQVRSDYLKCCLHAHTKDGNPYSPEDLITSATRNGYDVLAITEHDEVFFTDPMLRLAEENDMLLIPGIEASIGDYRSHLLILNTKSYPAGKIKLLKDFKKWLDDGANREEILVIAPHPFYPGKISLGKGIEEMMDYLDAIEYSHFRPPIFDSYNKMAAETAVRNNKPLLGTGDVHMLWQLDSTYSLIKSAKSPGEIVRTVKRSGFTDCAIVEYDPGSVDRGSRNHGSGGGRNIVIKTRRTTPLEFFDVAFFMARTNLIESVRSMRKLKPSRAS